MTGHTWIRLAATPPPNVSGVHVLPCRLVASVCTVLLLMTPVTHQSPLFCALAAPLMCKSEPAALDITEVPSKTPVPVPRNGATANVQVGRPVPATASPAVCAMLPTACVGTTYPWPAETLAAPVAKSPLATVTG